MRRSPRPRPPAPRSRAPAPRPSGAATRGSSSTPTGTRGRSPTTPAGPSTGTAGPPSAEELREQLADLARRLLLEEVAAAGQAGDLGAAGNVVVDARHRLGDVGKDPVLLAV